MAYHAAEITARCCRCNQTQQLRKVRDPLGPTLPAPYESVGPQTECVPIAQNDPSVKR
jgi:hypothetical protein